MSFGLSNAIANAKNGEIDSSCGTDYITVSLNDINQINHQTMYVLLMNLACLVHKL